MTLKAVLFDLDGTLIDSEGFYMRIWKEVLARYEILIEDNLLLAHLGGKTEMQAFEVLQLNFGFTGKKDDLLAGVHQLLAEKLMTETVPLMPGVRELIEYLIRNQVRMAVVTSSKREITELHLGRHHLLEHFEFLVTRNEVQHTKPDPEPYQKALQQLELPAEDCLVLEDSPTGLAAAQAAGLPCVVIQHIQSIRQLLPAGCQVFDNLFEVREFIEES